MIPSAFGEKSLMNFGFVTAEISRSNCTHPKYFFEDHILARKGCSAPKFLHVLENEQVLLMHFPLGM